MNPIKYTGEITATEIMEERIEEVIIYGGKETKLIKEAIKKVYETSFLLLNIFRKTNMQMINDLILELTLT